jgi:hypothetical protein
MPDDIIQERFQVIAYNREKAVEYAHKWAQGRNPMYFDFENYGGDCTNFASQCVFAGSGIMNPTPVYGWYYYSSYNRTASWTGVNFLYNFLVNNMEAGPFAEVVDIADARPGDIAQLSFENKYIFNHSPVIVEAGSTATLDNMLIAAHTFNADYYPVKELEPLYTRFIHIKGVRTDRW